MRKNPKFSPWPKFLQGGTKVIFPAFPKGNRLQWRRHRVPHPRIAPGRPFQHPKQAFWSRRRPEGESMLEDMAQMADSSAGTHPIVEGSGTVDGRASRKCQSSVISGTKKYHGRGGSALAAREFCCLQGYHSDYVLRQW